MTAAAKKFEVGSHSDNERDNIEESTTYKTKHSSGDLHSRLKTRKLLGVGETDDGDVHRSKLSQILGHSDQLYIRLPSGLRLWQIVLAVVFSVLSLWALLFPGHFFKAVYDMDGSSYTFPIRLYACALICISVIYWSTVQAADRDVIRMVLLSSVIFFTLQSCVMVLGMVTLSLSTTRWTVTLLGLQCVCSFIGYFFHCGMVASRHGCLIKTTSSKDLTEKDQ